MKLDGRLFCPEIGLQNVSNIFHKPKEERRGFHGVNSKNNKAI